MKKYLIAALILFSLTVYVNVLAQTEETITLTTYYPSPYGVYNEMKLYPHSPSVTPCSSTQEGLMYYDSIAHALRVCMCADPPTCSTYSWVDTTGYWTLSGSNLYPDDTSWNVGIGTTAPATRLHIRGTANQNLFQLDSSTTGFGLRIGYQDSTPPRYFKFEINPDGTGYSLTPLRIDWTGKVTIGGTSFTPAQKLEIAAIINPVSIGMASTGQGAITLGGLTRTRWPGSGYERRTGGASGSGEVSASVLCSVGKKVLGGGCGSVEGRVRATYPMGAGNGWVCVKYRDPLEGNYLVQAVAICAYMD